MADPPARPFLRRGPSGPLQGDPPAAAIIQAGYDQAEKTQVINDVEGFIPRVGAPDLDPLQVVLEDITPENFIEFDWSMSAAADATNNFVAAGAVVYFGADPPPAYPDPAWFIVVSGKDLKPISSDDTAPDVATLRAFAAFKIPDGVTRVTVRLRFLQNEDNGFIIIGTDTIEDLFPAVPTLKVYELNGAIVTQPGPTTLIASA
jgi:hypothetical protein